ncbi:NYN domain-containing protein [Parachaetomium inaequale]|uniref:NYN domain-containing protein n=1 Tax=Parachaetomium inaequale TaxID=2588326 RepID=A0AAN6P700_9PEZI|nr:NYN domain-containing protein [Parachaetomium inaequale]
MASDSSATKAKLAVLIDADNAQSSLIGPLLAEVARYGTVCVKRAYGDWTGTSLKGWKEELLKQAIQPIQQFSYTHGKNATDSAMIIEAMDLLYSNRFGGFCLVSSDSDFTRLAVRIRESGLVVYGFGVRRTPQPFVTSCNKFIYVENLVPNEARTPRTGEVVVAQKQDSTTQVSKDTRLAAQLQAAVEAASNDDRWAELGKVRQLLTHRHPDFDSRNYGCSKFSDLITATSLFDIHREGKGGPIYIHAKDQEHATVK